jgi:galactose mutarotase-like enzyme
MFCFYYSATKNDGGERLKGVFCIEQVVDDIFNHPRFRPNDLQK